MFVRQWTPFWTADEKVPIRWIDVDKPYEDWLRDSQDWKPKYVSTWNTADYVAEQICHSFRFTENRNRTVIYGSTPTSDLPVGDDAGYVSFETVAPLAHTLEAFTEEDDDCSFIDDLL